MSIRTLYRPVGLRELELILDADARAFPPRLPSQPIFYPVLNDGYAAQIAREWNPTDAASGFAGFVTEFDADEEYLSRFPTKTVGAKQHQELWVPAEELDAFNRRIHGRIRVTFAFYGPRYEGPVPEAQLRGCRVREQLARLQGVHANDAISFREEIAANRELVMANFGFWRATSAAEQGLADADAVQVLSAIDSLWTKTQPDLPLPKRSEVPRAT